MQRVGIQNLSRYARRARDGESSVLPDRASVIDRLVAERGARRAQGNLLERLGDMPPAESGPPTKVALDELRAERV